MKGGETDYTRALIDALNALPGVFVWRQQAGVLSLRGGGFAHCAPKGASDIIGVARVDVVGASRGIGGNAWPRGLMLSIETKSTKTGRAKDNGQGTLEAQAKWRTMMCAAGAIHIDAKKREAESMDEAVVRVVAEVQDRMR